MGSRKKLLNGFENIYPNTNDEVENIGYYPKHAKHRDCDRTMSERYIKILDFRHFERHFGFSRSDRKTYKKAILDGVNVSVYLDGVSGNISK